LDLLIHHIESLIFCSPDPITKEEIRKCLEEMFETTVDTQTIEETISALILKYESDEFASISILLKQKSKKRLSTSALETLSIIAYKQPLTKGEMELIRGVSCDYSIQKLLEKELIEIKGKADTVGKPLLYGTNQKLLYKYLSGAK